MGEGIDTPEISCRSKNWCERGAFTTENDLLLRMLLFQNCKDFKLKRKFCVFKPAKGDSITRKLEEDGIDGWDFSYCGGVVDIEINE